MNDILEILMRAVLVIGTIILLTRVHGLRSFSKLSGFDFAITVSIGSVLAGAVTTLNTSLWTYTLALVALFVVQITISRLRVHRNEVQELVDNAPLLIMENGVMVSDNLRRSGLTESDVWAKLREANAYDLDSVRAVIVETTGDVSVLHGPKSGPDISAELMKDIDRGAA